MAKDQSQSDFVQFFKSNKEALQNLKDMKAAQIPGQQPDIADGDYVARIQSGKVMIREFTINGAKTKAPMIRFQFVVNRGAYEGTSLNKDYILAKLNDKIPLTIEEIYQRCAQDLILMGADKNCFKDAASLAEEVEGIAEERPLVRIRVKVNAKGYVQVYVQGLAEDAKPEPEDEDEQEEVAEVEGDEEETEEGDEDANEEESEDDEEGQDLEIGDRVKFQPKGGRKSTWTVHAIDEDSGTCTLRDVSGKTVKGVSWEELEFA